MHSSTRIPPRRGEPADALAEFAAAEKVRGYAEVLVARDQGVGVYGWASADRHSYLPYHGPRRLHPHVGAVP